MSQRDDLKSVHQPTMLSQTVPKNAAKRLLIIDAMNVMHMRMKTNNNSQSQKQLDCFSILPIMRYFVRRGHAVEVVMPEFCIYKKCFKNFYIWKDLNALKLLILVPYMMHDDLVALTVARDACGSVITQDKFRDHLACFPQLRQVRSRNIKLAFMNDVEKPVFFTNAKGDKYYKGHFMCMNYTFEQFYSLPEDGDYDLVKEEKWSENRRKDVLKCIDKIYGLAEAQYMLAEVEQLPKCNNLVNMSSSTDIYEKIVKDGKEQEGIAKNENMKALLCWRNTAEKQELKYQLQERCNGAHQRYINFNFTEDSLPICESSSLRTFQGESWKDDTSKSISIVIEENSACKGSITETINLLSTEKSIKHETEAKLFKNDKRAESKAFLWKTLTDEVKVEGKSFYEFLSSFDGILEKEFVLNAYYDQINNFSPSKEKIINPDEVCTIEAISCNRIVEDRFLGILRKPLQIDMNITEATSTELCSLTSTSCPMMDERSNRSFNETERILVRFCSIIGAVIKKIRDQPLLPYSTVPDQSPAQPSSRNS
ncbi:NEDD4-binding protein [Dirofilaria immitis]